MEKDELAELGGDDDDDEFEIIIGVGVDAGVIMDASRPNIVASSGFRLSSLSFRFISS